MKSRNRGRRTGAVVLALCVLALAAFASSASAAYQKAKFDKASVALTTTGLTLERNGGSAKTCTPKTAISGKVVESSFAMVSAPFGFPVLFACSGSTELEMVLYMEAQRDPLTGATRVQLTNNSGSRISPWGSYSAQSPAVPYTNGTGAATPSTINFNKTVIGSDGTGNLTLTGTFNVMYNATETVKIVP